ncbi:hypothetical protein MHBO_004555, partial [Bonamia ostreae]
AFTTKTLVPCLLPRLFYRFLSQESPNRRDLEQIDFSICKSLLEPLEKLESEKDFENLGLEIKFGTELGKYVSPKLIGEMVNFGNRLEYSKAYEQWLLHEKYGAGLKLVCEGFWDIFFPELTALYTSEMLRNGFLINFYKIAKNFQKLQ